MNSVVSVASIASATALAAPASGENADADLIALCQRALDKSRQQEEAAAVADDLLEKFYTREPDPPRCLNWHPMDPVTYSTYRLQDGREIFVCNRADIERKRGEQFMCSEWLGTEEQYRDLPRNLKTGEEIIPEQMRHLLREWPDEFRQKRFAQIVAAHDEYQSRRKAIRDELGLDAADARSDELSDQLTAMTDTIERTPAVTMDGLRAKAAVIAHTCWCGSIPRDQTITADRLMASIISDLTGLPDQEDSRVRFVDEEAA